MTDRINEPDDIDHDDWQDADDDDLLDFTVDEFDGDMIAAASLMPDHITPDDDTDILHDDFDAMEDDPFDDFDEEVARPKRRPQQNRRKPAPLSPSRRQALRAEMARVFGKRRAEPATDAFMNILARLRRQSADEPDLQQLVAAATRRLARRTTGLRDADVQTLTRRIHAVFQPVPSKPPASQPTMDADLRTAKNALRQAARYLLRVERRIADRQAGQG